MKTKNLNKKLSLSKATIARLESAFLTDLKGGAGTLEYPCLTAPLTGIPCEPCKRPSEDCF